MSLSILDVKPCSKPILAPIGGHGKSPCFLEVTFLSVFGPDYPLLVSVCFDVGNFLECVL
jgi:hypothetical protein